MNQQKSNVIIISVTSGIGEALAKRYSSNNYDVVGTYRHRPYKYVEPYASMWLLPCDIDNDESVSDFVSAYRNLNLTWDTLILCPCNPLPIKPFFECEFKEWSDSVHTNVIGQLHVAHELYPFRKKGMSNLVFFAAGGVNNSVTDLSAYTASKIMLIKMCELLDTENSDMNVFIIGPGWTKTKVHDTILSHSSGDRYNKTLQFIADGQGTSMDDIYNCIVTLCKGGKVVSGRNFSVVDDKWDDPKLLAMLNSDQNMYKLRRWGNEAGRSI